MNTVKPQAVVFDLGKVLLDFDYGRAAERMLAHCSIPRGELVRVLNQSSLLLRYEAGLMSTGEFFAEVKRASNFSREFTEFEPLFADIFTPIPEMIDLHHRLRSRGVPTYIFSNTNEMAIKHIRRAYPFFGEFTGYVFSYEHGCMKPRPEIYAVVEKLTGHHGPELLYIDDRPENVQHGAERGWQTIHHHAPAETIRKAEDLLR